MINRVQNKQNSFIHKTCLYKNCVLILELFLFKHFENLTILEENKMANFVMHYHITFLWVNKKAPIKKNLPTHHKILFWELFYSFFSHTLKLIQENEKPQST